MATKKKMLQAAAGNAGGGAGLDVTEVFSTYLYTGTEASTQTITNGIDLAGEGGLVWAKARDGAINHVLMDSEQGVGKFLNSNQTYAQQTNSEGMKSFNSNGFTFGTQTGVGWSNDHVYWTFRKAPKFFDVVTYTGDTVAGRAVSHNLGSVPGMIMVKRLNTSEGWFVYHRGMDATSPEDYYLQLDTTAARVDGTVWNDTAPTDTHFILDADSAVNASGNTYVAYLFAHNDGDGGFGPDGDQDIIKCGSFTEGASGASIDLGFEPQFLLFKRSSGTSEWYIVDAMRGMPVGGTDVVLNANSSAAEGTIGDSIDLTPTGFNVNPLFGNTQTSIYMAIRRGPLAQPESATEVFAIDTRSDATSNPPSYSANGIVDMALQKELNASGWGLWDRLRGQYRLQTHLTNAEDGPFSYANFDHMDGWGDIGATDTTHSWMWKRAPGYFDVVTYTGNSTVGRTVSHNLGVAPEMMWVKVRDLSSGWPVWHTGKELYLNSTAAKEANPWSFNNTDPTATSFTLNSYNSVNGSGYDYIAYLFASLDGVSKVGSYVGLGAGNPLTVDCGFTSGARFVLIKKTDAATGSAPDGSWFIFDSVRGITTSSDPYLQLNATSAEASNFSISPHSSGFTVIQDGPTELNQTGKNYIFYAIA